MRHYVETQIHPGMCIGNVICFRTAIILVSSSNETNGRPKHKSYTRANTRLTVK